MNLIHYKSELLSFLEERKKSRKIVGLVPTMGTLHQGHLSLIEKAKENCDLVVVSIFVNPTQFDNPSDLENYPKNLKEDVEILNHHFKNIIIFAPHTREIYGDHLKSEHFDFEELASKMEGKSRQGHFDGVGTILKKLFNLIQPDKAFFGKKDYQQLMIVKKLVNILEQPIEIVGCPISRERNGLARSSRNKRLSKSEREKATLLYKNLKMAQENFKKKPFDYIINKVKADFEKEINMSLDYFEIADSQTLTSKRVFEQGKKYRAFIAARVGKVRLIDNMALN